MFLVDVIGLFELVFKFSIEIVIQVSRFKITLLFHPRNYIRSILNIYHNNIKQTLQNYTAKSIKIHNIKCERKKKKTGGKGEGRTEKYILFTTRNCAAVISV